MSSNVQRESFWRRWGPAILVMVLIYAFSSIPSKAMPNLGQLDFPFKKAGHMMGYALLSSAYWYALGMDRPRNMILAWVLAVLYACTDEFHQSLVPGRNPWFVDILVDAAGAAIGLLLALNWRNWRAGRKDSSELDVPG